MDDLDLNGAQLPLLHALVKAAAAHSPAAVPIVAIVISAQPKTFGASLWTPAGVGKPNALVGELGALLAAWRPGEEGGTAVVDIVTGRSNPSGRLSHTWPAKAGQVHSLVSNSFHMPATGAGGSMPFTTGPLAPLFPFGFGLSFTNFSIGEVVVKPPASGFPVNASERFSLVVPISSVGPAGAVAIQVYMEPTFSQVGQAYPKNRLLCWALAAVPKDGHATATISCAASDLGMWDLDVGDYVVKGGAWQIRVAQHAGDPNPSTATVAVASSPLPMPGQSMRAIAKRFAAAHRH